MGLEKYGRGRWKKISQNHVWNKTPSQVFSHAQSYFRRIEGRRKIRTRNFFKTAGASTTTVAAATTSESSKEYSSGSYSKESYDLQEDIITINSAPAAAMPPRTLNLLPPDSSCEDSIPTLNLFPLSPMST